MKKFISVVLALVMALSLTTMAWGAAASNDPTVSESTITLADNLELTNGWLDVGAGEVVTLNLNGKTLSRENSAGNLVIYIHDGGKLTVNGPGTIDATNLSDSTAIHSDGNGTTANAVVLNGVTVKGNKYGVYHNGTNYGAAVTINNSTVEADGVGVFLSGSKAWADDQMNSLTITNASTIKGGTAVEVKRGNVVVDDSTLTATDAVTMVTNNNGATTSGYALALTHSGANGNSEAVKGKITVNSGSFTGAVGIQAEGGEAKGTDVAETNNTADASISITGGTFDSDVSEYVADGMSLVDGTVVKTAGQFIGSGSALTSSKATYGNTLDAALANKIETVEVKPALSASDAVKSFATYQVFVTKTADKTVSVLPSQYIVVPTATNADIVVVDGSKIVYLSAVAGVTKYNDVAKAVKVAYDADPDCGDVYVDAAADAGTYYLYKNAYYVECAESSASIVFNVDGVAVYAKATPVVKTLPHTYGFDVKTVAGKTSVTSVYCTACKASFSFVVGDVADAVKTFGAGNYADTGLNAPNGDDIFVRTAATVVGTPVVGGTVTSADTFDAGIALYVGMSIMAATGAVVLKKRED